MTPVCLIVLSQEPKAEGNQPKRSEDHGSSCGICCGQCAYSLILCIWVSVSPEEFIHVRQVLAITFVYWCEYLQQG